MQAIPFRLENDEELAAFFLLRRAWSQKDGHHPGFADFWSAYRRFLGVGDDWDVSVVSEVDTISPKGFAETRKYYRAQATAGKGPAINDQIRFPGGKVEVAFRFLSAYRIPDGVLFQQTVRVGKRELPTALEVAAVLDSPFARDALAKQQPKVLTKVDEFRSLFHENGRRDNFEEPSLYV